MHNGNSPSSPEPRTFTFFPDRPKEWKKKERIPSNPWRAPEHSSLTKDMKRDWPRDDLGRRIPGEKILVMDARPTCLRIVS